MSDQQLEIVIKAVDDATQEINEIRDKLDKLGNQGEKTGDQLESSSTKAGESMTASFFKAQVAVDALYKAFDIFKGMITGSIQAWQEQETVIAQTEAVLKSTAKNRIGVYEQVQIGTKQVTVAVKDYESKVRTAEAAISDMTKRLEKSKEPTESAKIALENKRKELDKLHSSVTKTVGIYKTQFNPEMIITAQNIADLASEIQNTTPVSDDAAQAGINMLLTFTNIGKKVLPEASQAMINMATAMNGGVTPSAEELKNTSIQLGKALNDPVVGVTALQRVGVMLTETQKEQIEKLVKQNDLFGAQKIILNELAVEFGGSAAAAADTYAGKMTMLNNQIGEVKETIGKTITDAIKPLIEWMQQGVQSDRISAILESIQSFGREVQASPWIDDLRTDFEALAPVIDNAGISVARLADTLGGTNTTMTSMGMTTKALGTAFVYLTWGIDMVVTGLSSIAEWTITAAYGWASFVALVINDTKGLENAQANMIAALQRHNDSKEAFLQRTAAVQTALEQLWITTDTSTKGMEASFVQVDQTLIEKLNNMDAQTATKSASMSTSIATASASMKTNTATSSASMTASIATAGDSMAAKMASTSGSLTATVSASTATMSANMAAFREQAVGETNAVAATFQRMGEAIKKAFSGSFHINWKDYEVMGQKFKLPQLDYYETGGWVDRTGPAIVHAGEFVMSRDMLAGRQPVPNNVSNKNVTVNAVINGGVDAYQLAAVIGYELDRRGRY